MVLALALAGCGGGERTSTTEPERGDGVPSPTAGEAGTGGDSGAPPPSRRDRALQRDLRRHLRQEGSTRSRGEWTYADVEDVRVRGRQVSISTVLGQHERGQAGSLCLAARRFFLAGGQGQTPFDVAVSTLAGTAVARC